MLNKTLLRELFYILGLDIFGLSYEGLLRWLNNILTFSIVGIFVFYLLFNIFPSELTDNENLNKILINLDVFAIGSFFIFMILQTIIWSKMPGEKNIKNTYIVGKLWNTEILIPLMVLLLFLIEKNVDDNVKPYIKLLKILPLWMLWNCIASRVPSGKLSSMYNDWYDPNWTWNMRYGTKYNPLYYGYKPSPYSAFDFIDDGDFVRGPTTQSYYDWQYNDYD